MSTITDRLAELDLTLPTPPRPLAAYVPAVRSGTWVFTSGQLPFVDGTLLATGAVGEGEGEVSPERAREAARAAALNALAVVAAELGRGPGGENGQDDDSGLEAVTRVVKVVGYVASSPAFTGQPGVVDGASSLLVEIFGDAGRHARSAVGVASLPLGASVEVELVVEVAPGPEAAAAGEA